MQVEGPSPMSKRKRVAGARKLKPAGDCATGGRAQSQQGER